MFEKTRIPTPDQQFQTYLNQIYTQAANSPDQKAIIEKKLEKVDQLIKEKIASTITISEYFDQLWSHPDIKQADRDFVVTKLETVQQRKKLEIQRGEVNVSKNQADLDVVTANFKMTPYEEFNLQEKIKEVKKKRNIDLETGLTLSYNQADLEVLHALNRPYRSARGASTPNGLHYTAGLYEEEEQDDTLKHQKAEEFVKKIKEEKKIFKQKMKQIEQNVGDKFNQDFEKLKQKELIEEEQRQKEKKNRLESHITELKARSEIRLKEQAKWEEDYKQHQNKKPLFKEIQEKYQKGYLIPELEERKRKLQEIRDFHKPINRDELAEHEKKVLRILEEQSKKKDQSEDSKWAYKKPDYESRHHKIYADELSKAKRQKEEDHMEKLKRKEKVMELLQDVKDKHLPKVDPQKELELMGLIDKLKNPQKRRDHRSRTANEEERPEDHYDQKKLGAEYLKSVKELVRRKRDTVKTVKEDGYGSEKRNSDVGTERLDKKTTTTSMKSEATALKRHNYLADLRRENKLHSNGNQVDLIIKNKKLDQHERKELLLNEVQKLEEKAKRKEQIRKFKKNGVEEDEEVDQIYINAIKAKLEMLGQ